MFITNVHAETNGMIRVQAKCFNESRLRTIDRAINGLSTEGNIYSESSRCDAIDLGERKLLGKLV